MRWDLGVNSSDSGPGCWAPGTELWLYPGSVFYLSPPTEPRTSEQTCPDATSFAASGALCGKSGGPFCPHRAAWHPASPGRCLVVPARGCPRSSACCCLLRSQLGRWQHSPPHTCASSPAGSPPLSELHVSNTLRALSATSWSFLLPLSLVCFSFLSIQKNMLPVSELLLAFYYSILFWYDLPNPQSLRHRRHHQRNHLLWKIQKILKSNPEIKVKNERLRFTISYSKVFIDFII